MQRRIRVQRDPDLYNVGWRRVPRGAARKKKDHRLTFEQKLAQAERMLDREIEHYEVIERVARAVTERQRVWARACRVRRAIAEPAD